MYGSAFSLEGSQGDPPRAAGLVLRVNARPQAAGGLGVPVEGVGQDGVTVQAAPKLRGVRGSTPGSVQMHCAHRLALLPRVPRRRRLLASRFGGLGCGLGVQGLGLRGRGSLEFMV